MPWWYGGYSGSGGAGYRRSGGQGWDGWDGWDGEDGGSDDGYAASVRAAGAEPAGGARWLRLEGGLVWVSCGSDGLERWSAQPRDGWSVGAEEDDGHLQARFRSGDTVVEVEAGCAGSGPAFRYRQPGEGSGRWRSSVI